MHACMTAQSGRLPMCNANRADAHHHIAHVRRLCVVRWHTKSRRSWPSNIMCTILSKASWVKKGIMGMSMYACLLSSGSSRSAAQSSSVPQVQACMHPSTCHLLSRRYCCQVPQQPRNLSRARAYMPAQCSAMHRHATGGCNGYATYKAAHAAAMLSPLQHCCRN